MNLFHLTYWKYFYLCLALFFTLDSQAQISASETEGCAPLIEVEFSHSYGAVNNILWNFDDGATAIIDNPIHTFQNPAIYTVVFTADGGIGEMVLSKIFQMQIILFIILIIRMAILNHSLL